MSKILYQAAEEFYQALLTDSTKASYGSDNIEVDMYEGKVTNLWRNVGYSQSYYSRVRKYLIETGCISIVKQGSRGHASQIVLHHSPDQTEFEISSDEDLTRGLDRAILTQKVQDIEKQVYPGGTPLVHILADIERRLSDTETRQADTELEVGRLAQIEKQEPPRPRRRTSG